MELKSLFFLRFFLHSKQLQSKRHLNSKPLFCNQITNKTVGIPFIRRCEQVDLNCLGLGLGWVACSTLQSLSLITPRLWRRHQRGSGRGRARYGRGCSRRRPGILSTRTCLSPTPSRFPASRSASSPSSPRSAPLSTALARVSLTLSTPPLISFLVSAVASS